MNTKITFLSTRLAMFVAALFVATSVQATPEQLDWDALTWSPEGNTNLSETFTTGSGDITVTFGGNTAGLDQAGAGPALSPAINMVNTGGLNPAEQGLYIATDYADNTNPMVTVTIDFTSYPGGVGNFSFSVFDNDSGGSFTDEMTVTAVTPAGVINPTSIVTGSANFVTNPGVGANTVRGSSGSATTSSAANITWVFGDAGTPVSGISQINIIWRNVIGSANPGLQYVNIHDFDFDDPMADVELTKSVVPASAGAGETVVFTLDAINNGPDTAPGLQVTDQLPAGFTYLSHSGGSYNPGTGIWDIGSLASSGTAQLTIDAQMEATGPWDNSAQVTQQLAQDTDSTPGNNNPAEDDQDNAVVTLLVPEIGTAKTISAGPVNNGDGTQTLTYRMLIANSGDVPLNNVQLVDNLATTYAGATGFVVDSVTSGDFAVNAGYNGNGNNNVLAGTDTLGIGTSGTVDVIVTVTPGATLGPYNNSATADGTSPGGANVNDVSQNGVNPDPDGDGNPGNNSAPTPVTFGESPQIGTAKRVVATPTNNGDGTYTLTYELRVVNSGDVPLNGLQVVDDMAATFTGTDAVVVDSVVSGDFAVNAGYDGIGNNNVLAGTDTLGAGSSGTVNITVTVTAGTAFGPFDNSATASGTSPGGAGVSDVSQSGINPDPDGDGNPGNNSVPTPISFTENPQIGIAKAVNSGPVNNGDGTHTLTYRFTIENFGDGVLSSVQATDNLANTFSAATGFSVDSITSADFAVNAGFNGNGNNTLLAGTDTLAIGATGTVDVTVTVTPGGNLGPYDNTVFTQGFSPGGSLTIDNSVDGLDPDPDGNGDPVDNTGPTPVSFGENPEIGTAKLISAGPTNNGDGTHTLTYRVTIANSGDVPLNNVQLVDDLAATYAGATGVVVDSVTSGDFAVNAGYDGSADTNVLAGTDTLGVGASGTVDFTVTVTPGGTLGPYNNNATADGTSPAGTGVSDVSNTGVNPDPDGDGDPGNNSAPTPVTFGENPEIGTAKLISAGPSNNGDGTHTLTYRVTIANFGDVPLNNVQLVDDLAATYAGAIGFTVDSLTSADFAVNAGYDGNADTNVLAGSDTLGVGASGTVDFTVTVTPGATLGPYNNNATADGTSPAGTGVSDVSNTGVNPDPDGDGNPGNNSAPTPVTFGENPQIGIAKSITAGPVNNGDGTHTLTYTFTLENFGDVTLNFVQAVENLAGTFSAAAGFSVDTLTSPDFSVNPGFDGDADRDLFDGTDTFAIGATGTVALTITVTPGGTLGPYDNSVFAEGLSPGGALTLDNSVDGLDPDPDGNGDPVDNTGPTPVTFGENPEIGTAKSVTAPVNNGDGTFTLTYTIVVTNSGDTALDNVQLADNLTTTYAAATGFVVDSVSSPDFAVNAGYDGAGDINVLTGSDTLAIAASGTVAIQVTVTPGGNLGPYDNTATASGASPSGTGVTDDSTAGANPDPDGDGNPGNNSVPTPVSFDESPQIGIAKSITAGPVNNGDGTHTLTYTFTLENFGDVTLNSVQAVENLAGTFSAAAGFTVDTLTSPDFTVNPGFDGDADRDLFDGTDTLAVAASGTVALTITVTPGGTLGPYDNSVFAQGFSPGGALTLDNSVDGLDPDPDGNGDPVDNIGPTPVTFGENPEIGTAKLISAGPTNNGDGTHTLTYRVTIANSGDVPLNNVQLVDDLAATYALATGFTVDSLTSADFAVNAGYDGNADTNVLAGSDTLGVAGSGTVDFTVTVTPGGTLGPYNNNATADGTSPAGTGVSDVSNTGVNPDPDGDGDPGNNSAPTPVTFGENPEIGTAKLISAGPTNNGDGTHTLTYRVTIANSGDVPLNNVQLVDDLAATYAGATGVVVDSVTSGDFAVNAGYDGSADTNVLAGTDTLGVAASGTVDFTVTVTPGGTLGPYNNNATADGTSPAGTGVSDVSNTGVNPDPDGDGDPGNNSAPTPVTFGENPEIGTAKLISAGPTNNGDGTHTLTYRVTIANSGDVPLNNVQLVDDLAATYAGAIGFTVDSVTSADFIVNPSYDGSADTNVLAGSDTLGVAGSGTVDFTVTVTPGGTLGPYNNNATADGTSPAGTGVSDVSNTGVNPDPDGDGNPGNNSAPTPVTFGENPEIGTAKLISAGPTNNGDGTFSVTYRVIVANSGDVALNNVQVIDNLAATYAGATSFMVDSLTSADFSVNAGYNGAGDTNLLTATDALVVGASGTIDVTVTIDPGGNLGPYDNTATASGTSPAGTGVTDDSTNGANPDPDGDGDPGNNSVPTSIVIGEDPQIGIAKAITAGPANNGDGTHTLTYTFTLENFGDVALNFVQAVENLAGTFSAAAGFSVDTLTSPDFSVNPGFDGDADRDLFDGTDTFAIGATGTVALTITVTPGGTLGPYDNSVFAEGLSPGGALTLDNSVDGLDPDPDGNGDPVDNLSPTPVTFGENPEIGTAKSVNTPTDNGDGTFTLSYTIVTENSGDVVLNSVQVVDDLAATYTGAAGFVVDSISSADFAVNGGYDGSGDTNLLAGTDNLAVGATGTISLTLTVTPGGNAGPYNNTAVASGQSAAGTNVSDMSTDGVDPDPGNDGPADDMTPTPVSFGIQASLQGNAWLDANIDDLFDAGEMPLEGWIIEVLQNGVVVATVPVNADGSYAVTGLTPGAGYSVQLRNPDSNSVFGTIDNITLPPGVTVIDQNLPIDPSGVVYDAVTRMPVPGVTVTMVDSGGTPLPASCLLPGQQNQVTGADGLYRFDVVLGADPACMSGDLFGIVYTNPAGYVPGISTLIPPTPGPLSATGLPDPFQVQPQVGPPMGGASTLYYLSVMLTSGDPNIINNHIPIDPVPAGTNVMISKRADRRQTVVGDLIVYTVSVQNPGAAIVNLTLSDMIPPGFTFVPGSQRLNPATGVTATGQRPVVFSGIDVAAGGSVELKYMLRVGAGVVQGDYINTVTPLVGGVTVGNPATAIVTVTADPDFEQTSVIGMVFNDANGDGWQDDGELGIPGVRLATVEGLIIETDAFGRYHIAGVDGGRHDRGRNFIIKVDPSTLPDGVQFTTENPRVQRITEGLLNRFDFGVRMPAGSGGCCDQIDVKIGEVFFDNGSSQIRSEFMPLIRQLADRLREHGGGTLFIEGHAAAAEAVAYTAADYTVTQHFAPRSAKLSADDKRELDAIIAQWRGVENVSVAAVGHTCDTPIAMKHRNEFRDNYELSRARAQTVASYVRLGLGISPEQVTVIGKGPDEPVASNATPQGGALNRRVELSISGQRLQQAASSGDLARDRANTIYNALRKLLGDELIRNINISGDTATKQSDEKQESGMTSDTNPGWLSRGAGALLGLLVGTAHADGMPAACTIDACMTENGYAIQILPSSDTPSPNDTRAALADDKRVDISGQFSVPVTGGGQLWATEDPSGAEPRLAAHAPPVTPVATGKLAMPISFYVYSNYPAFAKRAEIQIFHGDDIDMIEPLAVVPFKPGIYNRVDWEGNGLSRALEADDELYFRVRVYDPKGHYDETHLDHLRLVSMEQYKQSMESDPTLLSPDGFRSGSGQRSMGPLDGKVLVLQPPAEKLTQSRVSYSLTPHFDSRKTDLKAQDRADIDAIVAEWAGAEQIRLHVVGHTDNIRIAPQNRREFANNTVLSEARARSVAHYIAGKLGLQASQIVAEGRGPAEPVASNATAEGRAQNRRVELTITGMRQTAASTRSAGTTLVEPHSNTSVNITNTLDEALNVLDARVGNAGDTTSARGTVYADSAVAQSSAHALASVYGKSNLRVQRIPVNGSRVRINGQDLGGSTGMRINGDPVPLDKSGKYAVEYLMPVGNHAFDVELLDDRGNVTDRRQLPVDVSGRHIFMVALADFTLSDNNVSGSIEPLSPDRQYDDDMLVSGRLAFYLKGRVKGKYLITAQMDSQEEEIGDLLSNLFDKDPQSILRRLDPDRYYPVYGDDSTTIDDTNSQGRLYVRADWDKSRAVWGNFHTGLTGNEFAQYNRSLYGAQYIHQSLAITDKGEARSEAIAFVSDAQTSFGHNEFLGTGGSLYYLKHQDILPGSDKVWVEVRDRDSLRVREVVTLTRGLDYEVDEIQGRIILSQPLMQVSGLHAPGLIKDTPLDGNDLVLLVDYEYIPLGFSTSDATFGGTGKYWLTDDLAVGATFVDESRSTEDYNLFGGDVLWKPGQGTYVKAEFAQSEATQVEQQYSFDGGLTFNSFTPPATGRKGDAWGVEARVNSREAMNTEGEWVGGAWYRVTDKDFSVARRDFVSADVTEYGVELTGSASPRLELSARASVVEAETTLVRNENRRISLQADYKLTDAGTVSGEVRNVEETIVGFTSDGLLLALRYSHKLNEGVEVYGIGQATLSNDSGRYDNNDLGTVGVRVNVSDKTTLQGEYSNGHRGSGALLNAEYRLNDRHDVYGTFTQSVDSTDLLEPDTKIAIGHRSRITDQTTLFNERQFVEDRGQAGIAHVFGLDFALSEGWTFGLSVQQSTLDSDFGSFDRDAATVTASYRSTRLNWRGKAEYRTEDGGLSNLDQVLTTNRLDLKLSEDWRLLTRFNHAKTEDDDTFLNRAARFTEAGIGFAYRPVANNRLNLLAKYTFLYDLPAVQQVDGGTDQRSNIVSLEGIYRLNRQWELGGKLAQRAGELRIDRDAGQWFDSTTTFAALRARYHLIRRWDALIELRSLDVDEAGSTRTGWLLGLDRHINDNFRVGVGYNFTDFSDDLTNLDYDHDGWFINALGKY